MKNKIFSVKWDDETDTICAADSQAAIDHCIESNGIENTDIKGCEEVPESEWDTHIVEIWPENDTNQKSFTQTFRELHHNMPYAETIASTNIDWL